MSEKITIVPVDDRRGWETALEQSGLPSQSWGYADALSRSDVKAQLAIVGAAGARMIMPFYEREWHGTTDIATTLGLSGFTVIPNSAAPLRLWWDFAKSRGWVAGYLQMSPFLELDDTGGEVVANNKVFILDLNEPDFLRRASEIVRRKIARAERWDTALSEARSELEPALQSLYPATMRRVRARPHYDFARETLSRWAADPSNLVLGASVRGSIEAVSIFGVCGDTAEYYINASRESGRELSSWLIWKATLRLREMGVRRLNLGGGMTYGDGLYDFKARFNGTEKPLRALRQIYDRETYDRLCREAGASQEAAWFPAYRAVALGG